MESSSKKRKVLNSEVTETLTGQIELDKTAEEFRSAHEEREVVMQQWEQIIDQMKRRDQEIDKCAEVCQIPQSCSCCLDQEEGRGDGLIISS